MKTFISAVPLFDKNMVVKAYALRDYNSERVLGSSFDFQMIGLSITDSVLDLVENIGLDTLTSGLPLFVDMDENQLFYDSPLRKDIPTDSLICVIPKDIGDGEELKAVIDELTKKGYRFAMNSTPMSSPFGDSLQISDYVFLDYLSPTFVIQLKHVWEYLSSKTFVFTNIPDRNVFKSLSNVPGALFSGRFYDRPISEGVKEISPVKINALQLLRQVNEADADLVLISETIERDPSISISLLRFINSVGVGLSRRVESIRAAVAILGQIEMKRWVTIAVSVSLAKDQPGEITRLSLIRAKFAENLAKSSNKSFLAPSLFTTGLFSMLDIVLNIPMEEAVKEVAVSFQIQRALVEKEGELHEFMDLIYAYERADWEAVSINMIRNGFEAEKITQSFLDAMLWYKSLLLDIKQGRV